MSCDNCHKSLYECFFEHNKLELLYLNEVAKKNNLCHYLVKYIGSFAFNNKHVIHYRRKQFYYYDVYEDSEHEIDDDSDSDYTSDRVSNNYERRCGYDISNHTYTICEKCMIVAIDYYYSYKSRLPFLRDDSYYFVWSAGNYAHKDLQHNHYIKNKYVLPDVYVCDFYRTQLPLQTSDGKLLITEK
jgi:hypothetical protein